VRELISEAQREAGSVQGTHQARPMSYEELEKVVTLSQSAGRDRYPVVFMMFLESVLNFVFILLSSR